MPLHGGKFLAEYLEVSKSSEKSCTQFTLTLIIKGLCHELRGYSAITHLALKIRQSIKHLNQSRKSWPSSSFSFPTTISHQIVIKLTSSSSKLSSQQQATNTKKVFDWVKLSHLTQTKTLWERIRNWQSGLLLITNLYGYVRPCYAYDEWLTEKSKGQKVEEILEIICCLGRYRPVIRYQSIGQISIALIRHTLYCI